MCLVPAFTGLGAPYWDRSASGILTGLTAGTTPAHVARAALEAVAHQVVDVVEAVESDGEVRIDLLKVDGGATASRLLMQLQADLLGRPVHVADVPEASALGAALLAARTLGHAGPTNWVGLHGHQTGVAGVGRPRAGPRALGACGAPVARPRVRWLRRAVTRPLVEAGRSRRHETR